MTSSPPSFRLAGVALLGLTALPAFAQTNQPADGKTTELAPLNVTGDRYSVTTDYQPTRTSMGHTDAALLDTPAAIDVVPQQVIKDQQVRNLDQALYDVSGITQANTLGSTQDAVLKRGFGDNRDGSILRDGMRTILPRNVNATTEEVQVLKGPASMLYGILDPGGVINVVSKKPELKQHGEINGWGTSFGGGGGGIDLTGPLVGNLAYRFIADYQNSNYWRDFGQNRYTTFAPSLAWYGDRTTVRLSYERTDYEVPFDRGTVIDPRDGKPINTPRERRFDEHYNISQGNSDLAAVEVEHEFNDQWKVHASYLYNHNSYQDNQARIVSFNPTTGQMTRRADATQDSNVRQNAGRVDVIGHFDVAGLKNELLFGVEHEETRTLRTGLIRGPNSTSFNMYNPVYGQLPSSRAVSAPDSDQTDNLNSSSVYFQDSLNLTDKWILVGGLRYQQFDELAGKGRPFNTNTDVDADKLVPRIGLLYKITPKLSVYGSYSESFKPNASIADKIGALDPEEGRSWEAGIKADLFAGLTLTAALFDIRKQNVMYSEDVGGVTRVATAGEVSSRGFEMDLAGRIAPDWSVIGSYAFTDTEVLEDPKLKGNRLPNAARHTASLFVTHDFGQLIGDGSLRAGGGGRYVGERAGDAANSFTLPDYFVADAFVSYRTEVRSMPVTFQLNGKNLFDKTYYTSSTSNLLVSIGEPREVVLQGKIEF